MRDIENIFNKTKAIRKLSRVTYHMIQREGAISPAHLSRIESGKVDPKLSTFLRYLSAINCTIRIEIKEKECQQ